MTARKEVLRVYKLLLREANKFNNYNFRNYSIRKIRDEFLENKNISDEETIRKCLVEARESLNLIRRQVTIGEMYTAEKLVIENMIK